MHTIQEKAIRRNPGVLSTEDLEKEVQIEDSIGFTSVIPDNSHYVDLQNDRLRCLEKV